MAQSQHDCHSANGLGWAASPNVLCLKPRALKKLPQIDQGSALIADPHVSVPPEIVAGLLHAGTKGVLASGSKVGKTWLLLLLAIAVATGTAFLKWATVQGMVLFINCELHLAFLKQRLEALAKRLQLPNLDNLHILTLRGQSADFNELLEDLIEHIQEKRYALIILDPIYKLMIGHAENAASGVGILLHSIERIAEKTGAAVVYAHHFTKGNAAKKKPMDRMSGSGVFARDADTIITLTEHEEKGCYAVEMTLRNLPPQQAFVVEWDFPLMVRRPDLDPADLKVDKRERDGDDLEVLLECLDEKPLTSQEWQKTAEEAGYSRATFFRRKQNLEASNRVRFDPKDKTWSRAADSTLKSQPETLETFETGETTATRDGDVGAGAGTPQVPSLSTDHGPSTASSPRPSQHLSAVTERPSTTEFHAPAVLVTTRTTE